MDLFHYTDVGAVQSILTNKKIWLSDVRFLNDSQELREGLRKLLDYLVHRVPMEMKKNRCFEQAVKYIRDKTELREDYGLGHRPVFVSSFSLAGDLLSQWRAYGSYAIEFNYFAFMRELSPSRCLYNEADREGDPYAVALESAHTIAQSIERSIGIIDENGSQALSDLIGVAATFKHPSFCEEKELRVIAGHDVDPDIQDGLDVKYRPRDGLLVPYVEKEISINLIKSITVGPMRNQDLAFASMREFVKKICKKENDKNPHLMLDISVNKSAIPFRAT